MNERHGLTFVEMLVALALLTLVSGSIAATLSGGLSIWARAQGAGIRDQAVQVAVAQVQHDLHQVRRFAPVLFEGTYDAVAFPAMVRTVAQADEEERVLGQLGYFFDSGHRRVCRSEIEARDLHMRRLKDRCEPLLADVDRVRFSYYGWDAGSAGYRWMSEWSAPASPLAVKIELGWRHGTGPSLDNQTVLVRVPIASRETPHP